MENAIIAVTHTGDLMCAIVAMVAFVTGVLAVGAIVELAMNSSSEHTNIYKFEPALQKAPNSCQVDSDPIASLGAKNEQVAAERIAGSASVTSIAKGSIPRILSRANLLQT
jgi:hypothetical protein